MRTLFFSALLAATVSIATAQTAPYKELYRGNPKFGFITGIHYLYGRLMFLDSPIPAGSNGGDVYVWDDELGRARRVFEVQEQGVTLIRPFGGKLYIPGADAFESWALGNFYVSSDKGETFNKVRTIPVGVHVWDICFWRGKMYASTGSSRNGLGYGAVCESEDGGQTWKESLVAPPPDPKDKSQFGRCYALIPTKGGLFASFVASNGKGFLPTDGRYFYEFDGQKWGPVNLLPERVSTPYFGLRFREIQEVPFILGRPNSYALIGGKAVKLLGLEGLTSFMAATRGDFVYVIASDPVAKLSKVYRADLSKVLAGKSKFEPMLSLPPGEEGISLEVAKDKLYIGTRAKEGGRLLELPLESSKGSYGN